MQVVLEVFRDQAPDDAEPVTAWLHSLREQRVQAKIRLRIRRLEAGLFGDCEAVGAGVMERREQLGAGCRIDFGRHGRTIVILLCGGSRKSQAADSARAQGYLGRLETQTAMKRKIVAAAPHNEREIAELGANRELAVEYLRVAMASLDDR
jgi:putative addiction module killer protein